MGTREDLLQRLDVLESESAIRRLMAEYQDARDFSTGSSTHIANLFTVNGIWEGVGRLAEVWDLIRGVKPLRGGSPHLYPSPSTF
jgi:hypothetical protein